MTPENRRDRPPLAGPHRLATEWRIWWLAVLLIGWAATGAACSKPESSEPAGGSRAVTAQSVGTPARASGPEAPAPAKPEAGTRRGGRRIDSDELVGLGELGLLPSLLQTLGTGIDCDFDDALSTCQ